MLRDWVKRLAPFGRRNVAKRTKSGTQDRCKVCSSGHAQEICVLTLIMLLVCSFKEAQEISKLRSYFQDIATCENESVYA
jgi:hypothetical protein